MNKLGVSLAFNISRCFEACSELEPIETHLQSVGEGLHTST